ncbi:MAG: hypothetical protein P4L43_00550 [Syntrophobacteraceae bacterium]|nr:hypothetical protein [Syntrophobacteraceae bacterium]
MKGKTAITAMMVMLTLVAFSPSAFAGCYSDWFGCCPCPREDFGQAYAMARDGQIANPDAGESLTPVGGLDGRAAVTIMKGYVESFKPKAASSGGGLTSFAITPNPGGMAP